MKQTLYKRANNGKLQEWTIEVTGDSFVTRQGYVGGSITETTPTVCKPKNVGRANETTAHEQAISQAESKVQKQKDKGYRESIDDVDDVEIWNEPMLAHKWEKSRHKIENGPIASQPKLDGIRCIGTKNGLFTRTGKPIKAVPHIEQAVKQILKGTEVKLDGELYNHDLKEDFNELISIVRKTKPTAEDIEKAERMMQYHVYDIDVPNQSFASRYSALISLIGDYNYEQGTRFKYKDGEEPVQVVETDFFPKHSELVEVMYERYMNQGYEGQMLRASTSKYENKRSYSLLKNKEFQDEEFKILDIIEGDGNRSGMMGRVVVDLGNGNTCKTSAKGNHDFYRELLVNKDKYIGKMATVRFQNYTPDGSLRFPTMIAIRDYE